MEFVAIVTILAVFEYSVFALQVGLARRRTGVLAPETRGNPEFERYFRVQQNTLENLIVFLPALWVFSFYVNALAGAMLGVVYLLARAGYAIGYVSDPVKRRYGFMASQLVNTLLMLGGLAGATYALLFSH